MIELDGSDYNTSMFVVGGVFGCIAVSIIVTICLVILLGIFIFWLVLIPFSIIDDIIGIIRKIILYLKNKE